MSWFGSGTGGKKEDRSDERGFMDPAAGSNAFDHHHNSDNLALSSSSRLGGGMGSGRGGMEEFQQFSVALQQQLLVQQAISDMSHRAFVKCVQSAKDAHLSGKEVACIHAATNKWLDTNEYIVGRLAKKQQQQATASGQFS